jgi:hypothetical protein
MTLGIDLKKEIILDFLGAFVGSILTFQFRLHGLESVAASALTTCLAWLFFFVYPHEKRYQIASAVYCGSFAGMTALLHGQAIILTYGHIIITSLAAGIAYYIVGNLSMRFPGPMLTGYGGKLGATAFVASGIAGLAFCTLFGVCSIKFHYAPGLNENLLAYVLLGCAGAVLPSLILGYNKWSNASRFNIVGLTALLGLAGGIFFPISLTHFNLAAAAFYTGLFVSMTTVTICPSLTTLGIAGSLSGIVMLQIVGVFEGIGGGLGLAAMLSVRCVTYLFSLRHSFSGIVLQRASDDLV